MPNTKHDADFEPARLLDIFNDDRLAVVDVLGEAATSICEMIDQLSDEVASGDKQAVARLLHTLTGVCANIGANRLSAVSADTLVYIRRNRTFPSDLVARLRSAYDRFTNGLQEYLETAS